jgi:hypothetical protein
LAALDLRLFEVRQRSSENPMSLAQIRDAAIASDFPSETALEQWLKLAVGGHRSLIYEAADHARAAVAMSPLQGAGYVYLAELTFLRIPQEVAHPRLISQAMRVRPHDSTVLFAAGREAIFSGQLSQAIQFWRRAYRLDAELRQVITRQLAERLTAEVFVEQFQLGMDELPSLFAYYQQQRLLDQAAIVGRMFLDRLSSYDFTQADDAPLWRAGYSIAAQLHDPRTIDIGSRAVQSDPYDYTMRRRFALELLARQNWEDAAEHLAWCARANRADRFVADKLAWARLQHSSNAVHKIGHVQSLETSR